MAKMGVTVGIGNGGNFEKGKRQANQELRGAPPGPHSRFLSQVSFCSNPELSILQPRLPTSSSQGWTMSGGGEFGMEARWQGESLPGEQQGHTKGWEPAKCWGQHPAVSHTAVFSVRGAFVWRTARS